MLQVLRVLAFIAGLLLVIAGIPLLISPIPVGLVMIALGLVLLVISSKRIRRAVRTWRGHHPRVDKKLADIEHRMPRGARRPLEDTDPRRDRLMR